MLHRIVAPMILLVGLSLVSCAAPAAPTAASAPPTATPTSSAVAQAATPTAPAQSSPSSAQSAASPSAAATPAATGRIRLVVAPGGAEARYRVREQLAERSLPNDAIGSTKEVTGVVVIEPDGGVVAQDSRFVVDLRNIKSDSDRRDNYVKRNTLQVERFPTVEFHPTQVRGLPSPLPRSGEVRFELLGDLKVRDVTRPTSWQVVGQVSDQTLSGSAKTSITFADFGMSPPRVAVVLSVDETINLELDFKLTQDSAAAARSR